MPKSLALLLAGLCCLAACGWAQEVKLPAEIKGEVGQFIRVKAETADTVVKWRSVDPGLNLFPVELLKDSKESVVTSNREGRFRLWAVTAKDGTPSDFAECVVIIGTPPPVPPSPINKVQVPNVVGLKLDAATESLKSLGLLIQHQSGAATEPISHQSPVVNSFAEPGSTVVVNTGPPLPPPVVAGPRTVLIVRESAKDSPSDARMYASLQAGLAHQYLESKGHGCFVLDVSEPLAAKWSTSLSIPLPALAILDDKGAVLFKVSLAEGATADEVISILKSKGG